MKRLKLFRKLMLPLFLLGLLLILATSGYILIEDFRFIEALYMAVITIGSVGFLEVRPLSDVGRIFTIAIITLNIGIFSYFITLLSRYFFDSEFLTRYKQLKMQDKINQLSGHVVICGFGRNGRESAQVLHDNRIPFVVLEEKNRPEGNLPFEVPYFLIADATKDEGLLLGGITRARAIITTLPVDADNLFVVLTARQLNPDVTIISRASLDSSVGKLKIAGANNVIMPDKIGGAHMATLVIQPDVVEMLSLMSTRSSTDFRIAELVVKRNVLLADLDLWKQTNCTVLGVKNRQNNYDINPPANYQVSTGESLIVMGSDLQIERASALMSRADSS